MKRYGINEAFYSLQGEGARAGEASVFLRFAGCNMACTIEAGPKSPGGFDCDTEFAGSRTMTADEIIGYMADVRAPSGVKPTWVVLTGGEPFLQLDEDLAREIKADGYRIAVETNGSLPIPEGCRELLDHVACSPKVAEHAIRLEYADELRYVRAMGQAIPRPKIVAKHRFLSPAFNGLSVDRRALAWCIDLVKSNPEWRLSVQQHKAWGVL